MGIDANSEKNHKMAVGVYIAIYTFKETRSVASNTPSIEILVIIF